jgi:opacity protein-like surface antigen
MRKTLLATAAALLLAGAAQAATLVGLTADGRLTRIDVESRRATGSTAVTGLDGRLVGIDVRPANNMLYGLTDRGQIVTIDLRTGRATQVSRLDKPLDLGGRATVDFNPVADRLRVMGISGQNLRINVDTGATIEDGRLRHADGPLAQTPPRITAGAYSNSVAGATATALYTLDGVLSQLNVQMPPNDGVQVVRGTTSVRLGGDAVFDILAGEGGTNTSYIVAGGALHTINLENGMITTVGAISGLGDSPLLDIAAMR